MQYLSAALLITALAIVSNERSVDAWIQNVTAEQEAVETIDKVVEAKVAVEDVPPNTEQPPQSTQPAEPPQPIQPVIANLTNSPELRPPSKPPITPDKFYFDRPIHYYNPAQKFRGPPLHRHYTKEQLKQLNAVYRYQNARLMQRGNLYYNKPPTRQPLLFAASTGKPTVAQTPKFSIPVQTINGIRTDFVRPPPAFASTTSTTTTQIPTTTTRKILRTKRIWPKRILEKMNITTQNSLQKSNDTNLNDTNFSTPWNRQRNSIADNSVSTTTSQTTTRGYRRVTRTSKVKYTTPANFFQEIESNDWVPILPSHFAKRKNFQTPLNKRSDKTSQTPMSRRSDRYLDSESSERNAKNLLYLQSYGIHPVSQEEQNIRPGVQGRKPVVFFRKKKRHPHTYAVSPSFQEPQYAISETGPRYLYNSPPAHAPESYLSPPLNQLGADTLPSLSPQLSADTLSSDTSSVTKVKHHHHHHHHRYVKTVEKPVEVEVKVEVPKPYPVEKKVPVPVPVEKVKVVDRPVPVQVEKRVPYPVTVRVPQPVPVKVIEKEYVPKPFPVVHHVPIVKHVQVPVPHPVPVPVEKRIPYPVQVPVPVEKRVPYPITVEKQVPYPYPVKIYVPRPYPVEKRVPYPVEVKVKEPFEVIRHVKVPVIRPYAVRVPHPVPYPVEKRIPYPIRVIKRVPYPVEVLVPQRIPVEKKVPIYIPKPYPVEKKIPYPIKVPYPVKVPVKVPVEVPVQVPVYIHNPFQILNHQEGAAASENQYYNSQYESSHNSQYDSPHNSQYESSPSSQYEQSHGASESPYYNDASESSYYAEEDADNRIGRSESQVTVTPSSPIHTAVTVHGNTGYNGVISRSDSEITTIHPATTTAATSRR